MVTTMNFGDDEQILRRLIEVIKGRGGKKVDFSFRDADGPGLGAGLHRLAVVADATVGLSWNTTGRNLVELAVLVL